MANRPHRFLQSLLPRLLPRRLARAPFCRLSWHSPVMALAVTGLILAGIWVAVYVAAKNSLTRTAEDNLAAVAMLKTEQIEQWLEERHTDADFVVQVPEFTDTLYAWMQGGRSDNRQRELLLRNLHALAVGARYRDITIRSVEDGSLLLSSGGDLMDTPNEREQAKAALKQPSFEDLHFTYPGTSALDVGFFSTIARGKAPPFAILHITLDPAEVLYPLVEHWPGASQSAETLLVRVEGDDVVYLNNLRHRPGGALRHRQPLTTPQLLAAAAATGTRGALKGIDYRNVPCLGYALPVAGTPWLLLAKIDDSEVYEQLNRLAAFGFVITFLLLFAGAWWIADRNRLSLARYRDRLERDLLAKRIEFLATYANDAILLVDPHGRIMEVNDRALASYGYTHNEMIGMELARIRAPQAVIDQLDRLAAQPDDGGLIFETEHRTRDGRGFPVEVSMRRIEIAGEACIQEIVRDISHRVAAEKALRASETRFRQLFDLAPIGTATVALDGRIDSANIALCDMAGYAMAKLRTLSLVELTHADDWRREKELSLQLAAGALSRYTLEKRLAHADGLAVWVQQDAAVVKDEDGKPQHLIVQFLDISERKLFVERIERLSRLYAAISRTNHAIVYSTTPQEVFRAVCRAGVEFAHLPLVWIGIADDMTRCILPVEAAGEAAGYLDGIVIRSEAGTPEGCGPSAIAYREQRIYYCADYFADPQTEPWHRRAAEFGVASSLSLPLARGGKPFGVLTVYGPEKSFFDAESIEVLRKMANNVSFALDHFDRDAQRRQAEEMLAGYAAQVEDLYQNSPCGYHSIDGDGLIVRINDTELRWLGYAREEVANRMRIVELLSEKSGQAFQRHFSAFMTDGTIADVELELRRKDGTILPAILSSSAVRDAQGNFAYSRTTIYDVTERKKIEAERAATAARIQTLSRRLVAVQEHERRQLAEALHDQTSPNLAAIALVLGTLSRTASPAARAEIAAGIEDAQALLKDTAANVREICSDLRPTLLDYSGLLPSLTSYGQQFSRRTGVPVRVDARGEVPALPPETESLLFRIVQEALTNCAKHAYAKGIDVLLAHDAGQVVLTVSDDGFGFDAAQLGQPGSAPGLGLITMRERAEFAGGSFSIASRPGQGTTVSVRLAPAATAPLAATGEAMYGIEPLRHAPDRRGQAPAPH
ncbi:MAG: PAS domain S-box protein [Rhodocyclales bacterium]|nr:PAS domain S-box protein [Rhodocyclales bacterium]